MEGGAHGRWRPDESTAVARCLVMKLERVSIGQNICLLHTTPPLVHLALSPLPSSWAKTP